VAWDKPVPIEPIMGQSWAAWDDCVGRIGVMNILLASIYGWDRKLNYFALGIKAPWRNGRLRRGAYQDR
jgi:hypothetical protein